MGPEGQVFEFEYDLLMGDVFLGDATDSGDADAGEDDAEERLEEEVSELVEPLELDELDELLRSLLRRHADCDPLSRKGQSDCLSEAETSANPPVLEFLPDLVVPLSSAKKNATT